MTGSTGFIGKALCKSLADGEIAEVVEALRRPTLTNQRQFDLAQPDAEASQSLMHNIDTVIHLACTSVPATAELNPGKDFVENVFGTVLLAQLAAQEHVKRFIYLSSGGTVYGARSTPASEEDMLTPISAYGSHKVACEVALQTVLRRSSTRLTILRVANPVDAMQNAAKPQGLLAHALKCAHADIPLTLFGGRQIVRDYLHLGDVVHALVAALNYDGKHTTFNIGSGIAMTSEEIVNLAERMSGKTIQSVDGPARSFDVPYNVLQNGLATQELGWSPMPVQDALLGTIPRT